MDESWRMRMGMPSHHPVRRSMEALDPADFKDVFGGPPRSVLSRKFSGDFTRSSESFYDEIFLRKESTSRANKGSGRSLPAFRIPARGEEGFYSDVFGSSEEGRRSRERSRPNSKGKSKSNSSSVLSSEELSPLRRGTGPGEDVALSSFASRLRPINVPCRWNSATMRPEEQPRKPAGMSSFSCKYYMENDYNDNFRSSYFNVPGRVASPETITLEPNSYGSIKVSVDDLELNSPSSPVSSLCEEPQVKVGMQCNIATRQLEEEEKEEEEEEEDDDDEVMSSYVIEINSDHRETNDEAVCVDEAIAWAKEKFQGQNFDTKPEMNCSAEAEEGPGTGEFTGKQMDGNEGTQSRMMETEQKKWRKEDEIEQSEKNTEMELLDEDIKLWSAGKETNIRLLLSTLHHILWPDSGWRAISLTALIESSQVKKAYQKARLCLHPDKLQQRGATLPQKYVADKAFSILQGAWAAFITQDVLFNQ